MGKKNLSLDKKIWMLTYRGEPCKETRPIFFYEAMGMDKAVARIISFGACNFSCPYCKRKGAFKNPNGSIVCSKKVTMGEIVEKIDGAINLGQVIRLSGGDPVMFQEESLFIAKYVKNMKGRLSMATNGSNPVFCLRMAPFLESAAVDLKDIPQKYGLRTGNESKKGELLFEKSLQSQKLLSRAGKIVDVRTPIFANTSIGNLQLMARELSRIWNNKMFWTLRLYEPVMGCSWRSPQKDKVLSFAQRIKTDFPQLKIGLRAHWNNKGFVFI